MERLVVAIVLGTLAAVAAVLATRRSTVPSTGTTTGGVPRQLHREDFSRPDAPWLLVLFSSATCESCRSVWARARLLERDVLAVSEVEAGTQRALHQRYGIDAVPLTLLADHEGTVVASFLGPVRSGDLAEVVEQVVSASDVRMSPSEEPEPG